MLCLQVYCLPDGYEVEDRSLEVIRYVLNPTFKHEEVSCKQADVPHVTALIVPTVSSSNMVLSSWPE